MSLVPTGFNPDDDQSETEIVSSDSDGLLRRNGVRYMEVELSPEADDWLRRMAGEAGLQVEHFASRLLSFLIGVEIRQKYVDGIREEDTLRALLSTRAPHASVAELAGLVERLAEIHKRLGHLARDLPLHEARDAVLEHMFPDDWPQLPRRSRSGVGGRPRLEDSPDLRWAKELVQAYAIRGKTGLAWDQVAARVGISPRQLNEYRRRAGLLDDD
jgi:hypothetical protein